MNKSLLAAVVALSAAGSLWAGEATQYSSLSPAPGAVTSVACVELTYPTLPLRNSACPETAKVYKDGKLKYETAASSANVFLYTEGAEVSGAQIVFHRNKTDQVGSYLLTIPEGFFVLDAEGTPSAAVEVNYTIAPADKVIINVPTGEVTECPSEIILEFPGAVGIINNNVQPDGYGLGGIRFDTPNGYATPEVIIEGNKLYIHPSCGGAMSKGEYALLLYAAAHEATANFPAAITLVLPDGTKKDLGRDLMYKWNIPLLPKPIIDPAEGTLEEIGDITLTCPEGITWGWFIMSPGLYAVDESGNKTGSYVEYWAKTPEYQVPRGGNKIVLASGTGQKFATPGDYVLYLRAGAYSMVGPDFEPEKSDEGDIIKAPGAGDNPPGMVERGSDCDLIYRYTIIPSPLAGMTEYEDNGTTPEEPKLEQMVIHYPYAEVVEINPDAAADLKLVNKFNKAVSGYTLSGEIISIPNRAPAKAGAAGTSAHYALKVTCEPPYAVENQTVKVQVPAGYLLCDGRESQSFTQAVKINHLATGVADIAEDAPKALYNTSGVYMGSYTELPAELPAGLYIFGGKKILK